MITRMAPNSNGRARHSVRAVVRICGSARRGLPALPSASHALFVPYENRTSLPGSISKSSVSESSVFGLTTSSTNFT